MNWVILTVVMALISITLMVLHQLRWREWNPLLVCLSVIQLGLVAFQVWLQFFFDGGK